MKVTFARSGVTARWDPSCESLLELAEAHGLTPDQSCRLGVCSICISTLTEGEVEYPDQTVVRPAEGAVLICCSRPRTDVVIEV
ncbi:MAG: 2Fe-2S iron-sulfur cluster binding domain-containing protein [bacterium]|nr:2Fe-2S iron-sulfur cluster binding domain-containing protein [bacterium]